MLDGYIRVSQVAGRSGESFISPSVQRDQIRAWAAAHQQSIGEIFEELDESGGRGDRPLLLRAIERIEAGHSNGLIVAKLDRFGRSLRDGLAAIERIRAAKGTFVSVQDGLDLNTDTGRLVFHILLSMGEWELDRIRTSWDTAKARAIARGVHIGRTPPFGYQREPSGCLGIDPETGILVPELFRRRGQGATLSELGHWLESRGVRTTRGNPGWCETTISRILSNRVYLGELRAGRHVARDVHPALVDVGTWQRAQRPRITKIPNAKTPTLLGGLLRCASCRMVLHSQTITTRNGRRIANYCCHPRSSQGTCKASAYITGPLIEPFVEQAFFGELFGRARRRLKMRPRLVPLQEQLQAAESALDKYRDSTRVLRVLGEDRYVAGLQTRVQAVDDAMQALGAEQRRTEHFAMPTGAGLEDRWPSLTIEQRRSAIGEVLDCVFVARGWGDVSNRVFVYARGQEPPNLPVRGSPGSQGVTTAAPLERQRVRTPPTWSKKKIRRKLEAFLADRGRWPAPEEFTRTGHGPLYAQLVRAGGPERWAHLMAVAPPRKKQGIRAWNCELAERTLRGFVRGRNTFPTRREFAENGYRGLYNWLQKHGGMNYWARKFELPRVRRSLAGEEAMRRRWSGPD